MTVTLDITNITEGTLEGNGSFDKLVQAFQVHLEKEYDAGRLTGADYASAYATVMQAAMAQSVQFELTKLTTVAQANLIEAQTDTQVQQTIAATVTADIAVATQSDQIAIQASQKLLTDSQLVQALINEDVVTEQKNQAVLQTELVTTQNDIATATKQNQIDISTNQKETADEQLEQAKVQGTLLDIQAEVATATQTNQVSLVQAQLDKVLVETQVITERGGFR